MLKASFTSQISEERFGPPHAVFNLSKIGLRYFRIFINASAKSQGRLAAHLSDHPNVGWIFYAEGWFNLAVGIWAKDNAEINDISQQVRNVLSPDDEIVAQTELTSLYSFGNRASTKEGKPMCIVDSTMQPVTLSPLEIDYIKLLALDSSIAETELTKILNIDPARLSELKKKLTDAGVIVGYQERMEYSGTYFKVFVDSLSRKTKRAENDLVRTLWNDKACIYFERANSKYDLEFELILKDESELEKYLKDFSDCKIAVLTQNVYTNLYPVNKVANLQEIRDTLLKQSGEVIDFRNSKLWYLNYAGAEAYLDIYTGNKKYFETMEKGELDLFDEISGCIRQKYPNHSFSVIDIGSGNGMKGRMFVQTLGERSVKAYYPIDIQPIELATTINTHAAGTYSKHPTLLDIENLSTRFPLKVFPNETQLYIFLGGTYGNFKQEKINTYLKPLVGEASTLLIAMPIVDAGKTDDEIIRSYVGAKFDGMVFGPLSQLGFQRDDFEHNEDFPGTIAHFTMEDRRLVSSLILRKKVTVFGKDFNKGTVIQMTTSWKPTLDEFKAALEKDFVIEKIFRNDDMAIAMIAAVRT